MEQWDYSLWLQPNGTAFDAYQKVIDRLVEAHGGTSFEPHLTVLGRITDQQQEVVQQCEKIAASTSPIRVDLAGVSDGDSYYQCIYANVHVSPELQALHETAKRLLHFDGLPNPNYMPHISLLYGSEILTNVAALSLLFQHLSIRSLQRN